MNWWQAVILGLVQGLTEFLPVSSSGHLAIGREILGVEASGDLVFEVAVHTATVLATIVVFRCQILELLRGLLRFKYNDETDYILKIGLSMVPVFIVGMFFKDTVEAFFGSLTVVGAALVVTATLLFFSDRAAASPSGRTTGLSRNGISWMQAFVVGLGQALAVVPGLSRSGTTISTGLLCGMKRGDVTQFSFLMVLVPILGEALLDITGGDVASSTVGFVPLAAGFATAFLSGVLACKLMISVVRKAGLKWFALYCAAAGTLVLIFSLT
ncbi:MAG: undecaprenyl-diphosphate phosphatase [Bacteroidales bacterium]|nr:undecaprenyl-diphosphate phosphatase [Bacteroidales bacterium]